MEHNFRQIRNVYLDYPRATASFAVIMILVIAVKWDTDVYTYKWRVYNFIDSIVRWSLPIFVMTSGTLFPMLFLLF